jgi:hypothetical protein
MQDDLSSYISCKLSLDTFIDDMSVEVSCGCRRFHGRKISKVSLVFNRIKRHWPAPCMLTEPFEPKFLTTEKSLIAKPIVARYHDEPRTNCSIKRGGALLLNLCDPNLP